MFLKNRLRPHNTNIQIVLRLNLQNNFTIDKYDFAA